MARKNIPGYLKHKATGQAIVVLHGKTFYLGQYNSKASREEYEKIISIYLANGRKLPPTRDESEISVQELAVRFLDWAEGYYSQNGKQTSTFDRCKLSLSPLVLFYGASTVGEFGPTALIFLREKLIESGLARETINKRIGIVRQAFRWGVARELVRPEILQALNAVDGLKVGRTTAPEYDDVQPVSDETVDRTLPFLPPIIADMVRVQRLMGGRPQDVYNMRACDIDRSGEVWAYKPFTHKTKYRKKPRILAIGPRAQAVLSPYIVEKADDPEAFLFSPADSKRLYFAEKRAARKTKIQPSQRNRRLDSPKRTPGEQYNRDSYCRAIHRAIDRHNAQLEQEQSPLPYWTPNQLRHSAGTEVRDKYGLEYAQAVLGHSNAKTTEIYAEINFEKAAKVAREIG